MTTLHEKFQDDLNLKDGDIVEAVVRTDRGEERTTDIVHFDGTAWRLGQLDGNLDYYFIVKVVGHVSTTPWPIYRPAV